LYKKYNGNDRFTEDDTLLLRFQTCFYKPLLNNTQQLHSLKDSMEKCLTDGVGGTDDNDRFVRCKSYIHEAREKGDKELMDLLVKDIVTVNSVQSLDKICPNQAREARDLQCHIFPGSEACVALKEKTFPFITNGPCKQVYLHANQCTQESSRMETDSLWKYLFKGQDIATKQQHDRLCAKFQSDLYSCFDKYFTAMAIRNPNQNYQVHKQGPLSEYQIAEKEAYMREKQDTIKQERGD
jgi:hypothetical protein